MIVLKILAAPFVVVLTVLPPWCRFCSVWQLRFSLWPVLC